MENNNIIDVNEVDFETKVLEESSNRLVVVDFWAPWCGPCKALTPVLEEVSTELADSVEVYKVNVDDNTELAQEHGVQSIPTMLIYKNGSLSETIVGLKTKDELIDIVNS